MRLNNAFTLSETLITLAIIGIVAALTIPSIIQKQYEKATIVKLKKVYSALSKAYQMASVENGDGFINNLSSGTEVNNLLKPYLDVYADCKIESNKCKMKPICGDLQNKKLGAPIYCSNLDYTGSGYFSNVNQLFLKDGAMIYFNYNSKTGIAIDVNGPEKPNTYGRDMFFFNVDTIKNQILPYRSTTGACSRTHTYQYQQDSLCADWIFIHDDMEYLHCDVDWDYRKNGNNKCK